MTKETRPWGEYEVIDKGEGYQVKRIMILPGQRFSYQTHEKRSENWTVVQGEGVVLLDDEEIEIGIGETIHIPVGSKHRLTNTGKEDLLFIEVQLGSYLGEDDITRFEDDYGRV